MLGVGVYALEMSDDSGAAKPEAPVSEPNFDTKCLYARLGVQKDASDEQVAGAPRLAIAARVWRTSVDKIYTACARRSKRCIASWH